MKLLSVDVETAGELDEYALQPWRVPYGKAWLTTIAWSRRREDGTLDTNGVILQQGPTVNINWHLTANVLYGILTKAIKHNLRLVTWNGSGFDIGWFIVYDRYKPGLLELALKAKWLDAMRVWRHLDNTPTHDGRKHLSLDAANKAFEPAYVDYKHDVDYFDPSPAARKHLLSYNLKDAEVTLLHAERLWPQLTERQQRAALIEASSFAVVAKANVTGMEVDPVARQILDNTLAQLGHEMARLLAPHGVTEQIVRSPARKATLLFKKWGLPIVKYTKDAKTGEETDKPSTDKEVIKELAADDERVLNIGRWYEALNLRTKFMGGLKKSMEYSETGLHTYPQASVFATYCVPGYVEVLTRQGWVPLDQWSGGDIVQVHPDLTMEFLPAKQFVGPRVSRWVQLAHKSFYGVFTHGHTMPYLAQKTGAWRTKQAHEFMHGEQRSIPRAGVLNIEGDLSPNQMRFLAAFQADGSEPKKGGIKFTFKKHRKIERMRWLLAQLNIEHREYTCDAYPDRVEFHIGKRARPTWTEGRKVFGSWLLNTTQTGLEAFITEIVHWDGSEHVDGGVTYGSTILANVRWVVTVAALTGRKATEHAQQKTMYTCHISDEHAVTSIRPSNVSEVEYDGQAYCATTQTGFWLARSDGHIFVTGNTSRMTYSSKQGRGKKERPTGFALHQMKNDKRFRNCVKAPEGFTLVEFDAAGQEFRWMAELSGDEVMLELCLPGEDAHSFMGAQISGDDYVELRTLVKADDEEATKKRKAGKVGNLCVAAGTRILTDRGIVAIQDVRLDDRVWDGVEFVTHDGVVCSGRKRVLTHDDVTATPMHGVLVNGEWQALETAARNHWTVEPSLGTGWARRSWSAVRIVDGFVHRGVREVWRSLRNGALCMWRRTGSQPQVYGDRQIGAVQGLRGATTTPSRWQVDRRVSCGSFVAKACKRLVSTLHELKGQIVPQLRRAWDRVPVQFDSRSCAVCEAASSTYGLQGARHRSTEQRWALRAGKLEVGHSQSQSREPQTALVYDIVNCGPRRRFGANGRIVHNSLQYRTSYRRFRIAAKVQYNMPITLEEALHIWKTYRWSYKKVPQYWKNQIALAQRQGYVETLAGRRVKIEGDWSGDMKWAMESTSINTPIQGTGGEQKYLGLSCLKNELPKYDAHFAWDLHDGVYFYVPKDKAMAFAERAKHILDNLPYTEAWGYTPSIPLPFDCKMGLTWGSMREVKFE